MGQRFAVVAGSYHKYLPSKIVYLADTYKEAEKWIKKNIRKGQHMYIDQVRKETL